MMKNPMHRNTDKNKNPQSGNIFFMLFASVALIGAMTVGAGNIVKGIVTSMSDVTRKTVAEEKMQGGARISIQAANSCDGDAFTEPVPFRDAGGGPHPAGGGYLPADIGATVRDPWGTEYGYCAWDFGNETCVDSPNRLKGGNDPAQTVVAIISAGKDRKFSTTCNALSSVPADCSSLGVSYYNDAATGHCYFRTSDTSNGDSANDACAAEGGHLVSITSAAEQAAVQNLTTSGYAWIGANDAANDGTWIWSHGPGSGTQFWAGGVAGAPVDGSYANWMTDEPNGDAGEAYAAIDIGGYGAGKWVDEAIWNSYHSICEIEPVTAGAVTRAAGSDDIVMEYTYNDANGLGGDDLWRIVDTKPGTAKIDKNIDVAGGAALSGPLNLMRSGLILPDDGATGVCDSSTDQQIRINFSLNPPALEICDHDAWTAVSMGDAGGGGSTAPNFALVQSSGARSTSGDWTNAYTFTAEPSVGNTIIVQTVNWASGSPYGIASVTDNYGNTYTKDNEAVGGEVRVTNWSAHVETTGADFEVTVEFDSWNTETSVAFTEWTGLLDPAIDATAENTAETDTGDISYSVGPTQALSQADELVLSVFGATTGNSSSGIVAPAGYTLLGAEQDSPTYIGAGFAYKTVADTLPVSATWSFAPTQWLFAASLITTYKISEDPDGTGAGLPSLPAGYVGFWRFDEGAGASAVDSSGNNITGTITGASWTTGKNGSALSFDGDPYSPTPNSVNLGSPAALNIEDDITIGAWLNLQSAGIGESFLYSSFNMSEGLVFDMMSTGSVIYTSDGIAQVGPLEFGRWSFVTMTIDSGSIKYYLNGNLAGTGTGTLLKAGSPMSAYIGANDELAPLAPHGIIDDFIIYDRALSDEEVGQLYQALGGEPVAPAANSEDFLFDNRAKQCRSAATGPFVQAGESDTAANYNSLFSMGSYLYSAGDNSGVTAFARNGDGTLTKIETRSLSSGNDAQDVYADTNYVYVANGSNGLTALRFNADGTSDEIATVQPGGTVTSVAVNGSYIYITNGNALIAYSLSGSTFTELAQFSSSGANDIWTDGKYFYLSSGSNGLVILTFNGTAFTEVITIASTNDTKESTGDGNYLYVNDTEVLRAFSFDGISAIERGRYSRDPSYTSPRSTLMSIYSDSSNIYMAWSGMSESGLDVARLQGDRITAVATYRFDDEDDYATSITSDGGYIYVTTNSGPIKIFSGFACFAGSNNPAGIAMSGFNPTFGKVGVGYDSSCAVKPDGSVWCWGIDATVTTTSSVPVRVPGSVAFTQIATATDAGVCGLDVAGNAWCWGRNDYGQLGNGGATGTISEPYMVPGNRKWSMISAGRRSYCAIESTGDMYCWGENDAGNLGHGGTGSTNVPTLVQGGIKWSYVAASPYATCGIDIKGQLWCWGDNYDDALGTGSTDTTVTEPVLVADPGPWVRVSLGAVRICAVKNDGSLWCWGNNEFGVGGTGNAEYQDGMGLIITKPKRIADPGPWKDVSVGRSYGTVCGIKQDGTAWCWGSNEYGQAGEHANHEAIPTQISDPGPWASISTGASTCAMKTDGSVWCWGYNSNGQLGDGTVLTSDDPVAVSNFPGVAPWTWNDGGLSISATGSANIALGSSTSIGYESSGPRLDCSAYGSPYYNDPVTGHCYFQSASTLNWDNAQRECGNYGGYLATITSQQEQNRFVAAFGTATAFWLGASDMASEGEWIYTGGELAGNLFWNGAQTGHPQNDLYNNWVSGSDPNGGSSNVNCAVTSTGGYWQDTDCTLTSSFVCELGTATARGGMSFPSNSQTTLYQYDSGSQLTLKATGANASTQFSWKAASAANTRSMGIDRNSGAFEIVNNTTAVDGWMHDRTPLMFINPDGNVAVGSASGTLYNKLTVNGGLRIGNDATSCHAMRAGALRYVGGAKPYEYCNGTSWVTF